EQGEVICYTPIETVFMVSAYAVSPTATAAEAQRAGDVIDAAVAHQAQLAGVSKMLLVVPATHPDLPEGEWKQVRVFERKIPQSVAIQRIGCYNPIPVVKYLN
ncbi:MAG TPA: hypothetical protein VNO32_26675, partial [Candidatus Acidoferrum sp.]|nr:hypothetical protein [Candidatus Acidoferrum sp.]